jgi:hypothetical protein
MHIVALPQNLFDGCGIWQCPEWEWRCGAISWCNGKLMRRDAFYVLMAIVVVKVASDIHQTTRFKMNDMMTSPNRSELFTHKIYQASYFRKLQNRIFSIFSFRPPVPIDCFSSHIQATSNLSSQARYIQG